MRTVIEFANKPLMQWNLIDYLAFLAMIGLMWGVGWFMIRMGGEIGKRHK